VLTTQGNAAMGSVKGQLRGKTKEEVLKQYRAAKEKYHMLIDYDPPSEKEASKKMKKDPSKDEWVLDILFDS
jgi:hypothetical protein